MWARCATDSVIKILTFTKPAANVQVLTAVTRVYAVPSTNPYITYISAAAIVDLHFTKRCFNREVWGFELRVHAVPCEKRAP